METVQDIHEILHKIQIAKYTAIYQVGDRGLYLPKFKGSTFRGAFGNVFKERFCSCDLYLLQGKHLENCVYGYIFETSTTDQSEVLSKYDNVPRPFIMDPTIDEREFYYPGERVLLDLILLGNAISYFPYFVYSFKVMGEKGLGRGKHPLYLQQIYLQDEEGRLNECIYNSINEKVTQSSAMDGLQYVDKYMQSQHNFNRCDIYFVTPTRMKWGGSYTSIPEFHIVIRNIIRRLSAIMYFHHNVKVELNFQSIFEEAGKIQLVSSNVEWKDWERFSNRQNDRIKLGGIIGKGHYRGNLQPFIPWLKLGEIIHIGKNPVFGLGKIKAVFYDKIA